MGIKKEIAKTEVYFIEDISPIEFIKEKFREVGSPDFEIVNITITLEKNTDKTEENIPVLITGSMDPNEKNIMVLSPGLTQDAPENLDELVESINSLFESDGSC